MTSVFVQLFSCIVIFPEHHPYDCEEVAILGDDGAPDPCDVAACEACDADCRRGCAILESYPPQYACPDGDTFDVYDVCPDWSMGGDPFAVDIALLGCGEPDTTEALTATAEPARIDVSHVDFASGCCPDDVAIDVATDDAARVLTVTYTVLGDDCDCVCGLDVEYAIDEVPSGTWTVAAGTSGLTVDVAVP